MPKVTAVDAGDMWGLVRWLLSVRTLFVVLDAYVVLAGGALVFFDLGALGELVAFVTMGFGVVAIGVLGAYVRWLRKEVADMNSPPPEWERDRFVDDE